MNFQHCVASTSLGKSNLVEDDEHEDKEHRKRVAHLVVRPQVPPLKERLGE
jgi:hypothetical protein